MAATDALFSFLTKAPSKTSKPQFSSYIDLDLDSASNELTQAERENTKIHLLLLKGLSIFTEKLPFDSTTVDNILSKVDLYLEERLKDLMTPGSKTNGTIDLTPNSTPPSPAPSWIYLHDTILLLETLMAISLFVSFIIKNKSFTSGDAKSKLDALRDRIKSVSSEVKVQSQGLKTRISSSGMLGHLVDIVSLRPSGQDRTADSEGSRSLDVEIEGLIDSASLELFCGSLMESWENALDGVISICSTIR